MHILFDVVNDASVVGMCELGWNNAQATSVYLFFVISDILFQQSTGLKYSVLHLLGHADVGGFSNLSRQTFPCTCITNLLSFSHMLPYTLWKTC
jgi:hypothetical protein